MCIVVQQRIVNYGFVFVNNYQGGGLRSTMSSKLMTDKNDDLMHKFAKISLSLAIVYLGHA